MNVVKLSNARVASRYQTARLEGRRALSYCVENVYFLLSLITNHFS